MSFGLKSSIQKIIAIALVIVISLGGLTHGGMIIFGYDEQPGMIYSENKSELVETFYQASTSGEHARNFEYGKPVVVFNEVLDESGVLWYEIRYELKSGGTETSFCPASNVLLDKNATVMFPGVINTNEVNLRNQAGEDRTTIIAVLNNGHKVEVLDSTAVGSELWYRIRTVVGGQTLIGWMYAPFISESIPDIEVDEEYEDYLVRIGFPESYVHGLALLHAVYPNWVFEPYKTGLTWEEVIQSESVAGRNLVYKTENDARKSYVDSEYNWYTNEWVIRDTSGWVSAHTDFIAYCMDPRNWMNSSNIFMFESLSYNPAHNVEGVNAILSGTFMLQEIANGDGTMLNYANAFIEIGKSVNASPYHLASRVRQEQGVYGTSPMISGTYSGFEGYYNYFNVKTYGTGDAYIIRGLTFAKEQGWNTRYKAMLGGAAYLAKNYISVGQDTLYFQKFDVVVQGGLYNHQYMTNVQAAISESKTVSRAYLDKQQAFVFKIPVYEEMPEEPAQFTASGNRNNYLKNLVVEGFSLTPTFDGAKTEYSLIVENSVATVKISAEPVVSKATVEGTGELKLKVGENKFVILCKSESGDVKTYTLNIIREQEGANPPVENPEPPVEDPEQPVLSGDNSLASLVLSSGALTPGFSSNVTEYKATVEYDIAQVTVSAKASNEKAVIESITGNGTVNLSVGNNTIQVVVRAENGTKKTYTIVVTRKEQPKPSYSSNKYVLGTYVTGVQPKTNVSDFIAGFKAENCTIKVLTADGKENTGIVATGNKLCVYVGTNLIESKDIIIYGDVNGDGKITMSDLLSVNRHVICTIPLKGVYLEAGDVNKKGDGATMSDLLAINRHVIGTIEIKQ